MSRYWSFSRGSQTGKIDSGAGSTHQSQETWGSCPKVWSSRKSCSMWSPQSQTHSGSTGFSEHSWCHWQSSNLFFLQIHIINWTPPSLSHALQVDLVPPWHAPIWLPWHLWPAKAMFPHHLHFQTLQTRYVLVYYILSSGLVRFIVQNIPSCVRILSLQITSNEILSAWNPQTWVHTREHVHQHRSLEKKQTNKSLHHSNGY